MAGNFPELWLKRVIRNMEQADKAPWLEGIPEVAGEVIELGAGTETEKNIIHVPISTFDPEVLVNNNTYPINAVEYSGSDAVINLNKFQTVVTTLGDDQVMGASFSKIDEATFSHVRAINKKRYGMAIHAMGPASHSLFTPVLKTTGETVNGRKRLIYDDFVALKDAFDKANVDVDGRRIVLCTDHWNDMLTDRKWFGDHLVNHNSGDVAPVIAGFKVYQYINNPLYTSAGVKKAYGAAGETGDFAASIAFHDACVAKKTGLTKQYFMPSYLNPRNQSNELNYRHYFVVTPFWNRYIGAIVSAAGDN